MRHKQGGNFLIGLFVGLVLGLGIALGVAFYLSKTPLPFLGKQKPPATKEGEKAPGEAPKPVAGMPQGGAASKGGADKDRPKFDFYKILPGGEEPDGTAFLYFSYVVGMTAQTSDTAVVSNAMRRLVTLHGVFSFFFNTVIVAASVNVAISLAQ